MKPTRRLLILAATAATFMTVPTSCGDGRHDDIESIRRPDSPAIHDPFSCHDFAAEAADHTTRIKAPGLSLYYTTGVIIERKASTISFTDISSGHRAVLNFSENTSSLTIDGQPIPLTACRVHRNTNRAVTIFAVTADNQPVVAVVSDL